MSIYGTNVVEVRNPLTGKIVRVYEGAPWDTPQNRAAAEALKAQQAAASSTSSSSSSVSSGSGTSVVNKQMTEEEKRRQHVATLTLSPIPEIAAIQRQAQEEYIRTGKWNPKYTEEADRIRKSLNPMYPGGGLGFNESEYILPPSEPGIVENVLAGLLSGVKQVADTASDPKNDGTTMMLVLGGLAAILLLRR